MEISDKINLINKAKDAYYNSGLPIMSDIEYDKIAGELDELSVGAPITGDVDRIKIPEKAMKSLKKVHNTDEIKNFFDNLDNIICTIKDDGLSTRLVYKNGELISANTRGDGIIGGDITHHAKYIQGIPQHINKMGTYIVDGESVILKSDFDSLEGIIKNQRNGASGALSTKDLTYVQKYKLTFLVWDVIQGYNTNSFHENLEEAANLGFKITPWFAFGGEYNPDTINEEILSIAKEQGIPCDGVVWKIDDIKLGESRGETAHHFNNACAWKPENIEYETALKDIVYDVSRTGQLTPVAIFEPVDTGDSVIERASLHNLSVMEDILGKYPDKDEPVWVAKMNMIIPQIVRATKNDIPHDHIINIPDYCPICGGSTEVRESDAGVRILYCANPECSGKLATRIDHFFGIKGLNAKGISRATIEKLIDWGWVNELADMFTLVNHKSEWINKAGFGAASVNKVLNAIDLASRNCPLDSVIAGIGIPLIGKTVAKVLAQKFKTYNAFKEAVNDEDFKFYDIDGFGVEMHRALKNFNYTELDNIVEKYLTIAEVKEDKPVSSSVSGMVFVITGKLSRKRDDIKADIEAAGGKVGSSVTGKTNYLVCNDKNSTTTKTESAKKFGTKIITEEELLILLHK